MFPRCRHCPSQRFESKSFETFITAPTSNIQFNFSKLNAACFQGGLAENDENLAPLTAFTLISLLEMYSLNNDKVIKTKKSISKLLNDTLPCLEPDENQVSDVYTKALTAYALALAGHIESSRIHINGLMSRAKNESSLLWWEKPGERLFHPFHRTHLMNHEQELLFSQT